MHTQGLPYGSRPLLLLTLAVGSALVVRRLRASTSPRGPDPRRSAPTGARAHHRVTIRRSPDEVYRAWRAIERLPLFFPHVASVRTIEHGSHWVTLTPRGRPLECDVQIAEDSHGASLTWESRPGGVFEFRVSARFDPAPADRGTEMTVDIDILPSGALGTLVGRTLRSELRDGLRRFKQWLEAGEVATVAGQSTGAIPQTRRPELRTVASRRRAGRGPGDVDAASAASFPASDAPASRRVS